MLKKLVKINNYVKIQILLFLSISFISIFLLKPIYGTTDDYILDSWLNGTYTGDFEKNSIFISAIFSQFISFLYALNKIIPWYGLSLLSLTFISTLFISYIIWKDKKVSRNLHLMISIILFSYLLWSYLKITYTSTGIILAISGFVSFYYFLQNSSKKLIVSSIIFIVLAFCLRPESLIAASIFFYPALIERYKLLKRNYKQIFIALFSIGIFIFINSVIQNKENLEFKKYRSWASQVQSLAGRPSLKIIEENIEASQWTTSEYNALKDLSYFDSKIFNQEWLNQGLSLTENYFFNPNLKINNILNIFSKAFESLSFFSFLFLIVIFLIYFNFKKNIIFNLLFIGNYLLFNLLLGLYYQNVARVSVPILVGFIIFLVIINNKEFNKNLITVISISTLVFFSISTWNLSNQNNDKILRNNLNTEFINSKFSKYILLIHGNQEFQQYKSPYAFNKKDLTPNVFMIGNWDTFSPHWYKRAKSLGLDGKNLTYELLNNEKLLWTAPSIPDTTFNLKNLLKEQGFGEVPAVRIDSLPDGNDIRTLNNKE